MIVNPNDSYITHDLPPFCYRKAPTDDAVGACCAVPALDDTIVAEIFRL